MKRKNEPSFSATNIVGIALKDHMLARQSLY